MIRGEAARAREPTRLDPLREAAPPMPEPASLAAWQSIPRSALSAGLQPGARVIPLAIEAGFKDRPVYTTSFQIPEDTGGNTNWVLWFAEREPKGQNLLMRPPVPWRKLPTHPSANGPLNGYERPSGKVQLSATIEKTGLVQSISLVSGRSEKASQFAMRILQGWQFLPALRNNDPVDVDALVEILFP